MKNLGFIEESSTGFGLVAGGFEMRRYDYRLTSDGQHLAESLRQSKDYDLIKQALGRIVEAGNPNYFELSIAAKAYYILRKTNTVMTAHELSEAAMKFNWEISPDSIQRAVKFLESVGLTEESNTGSPPNRSYV